MCSSSVFIFERCHSVVLVFMVSPVTLALEVIKIRVLGEGRCRSSITLLLFATLLWQINGNDYTILLTFIFCSLLCVLSVTMASLAMVLVYVKMHMKGLPVNFVLILRSLDQIARQVTYFLFDGCDGCRLTIRCIHMTIVIVWYLVMDIINCRFCSWTSVYYYWDDQV